MSGPVKLSTRQRLMLETIQVTMASRGYPPSLREIGDVVGLASPSSVAHQLASLERLGCIRRVPNRPRAIQVVMPSPDSSGMQVGEPGGLVARVTGILESSRTDGDARRAALEVLKEGAPAIGGAVGAVGVAP